MMPCLARLCRGFIVAALCLAAVPLSAGAATLQQQFQEANGRYWKGDYAEAARLYEDLVARYRLDNPELYFNLGNAYLKQQRLGAAVLYYRRALAAAPSPDTQAAAEANLSKARELLRTRSQEARKAGQLLYDETHGVFYTIFHLLRADTLAVLLLGSYLGFVALLLVRRLFRSDLRRRVLRPLAVALGIVAAIFGVLTVGNAYTSVDLVLGVVVRPDATLRSGRSPDAPAVALPEGLEVRLLGAPDDGFVRVQLGNGREGYVAEDVVKQI